ncbi:ribosome-inactivating family protein [Nonomuraea sp. NPDC001699]
MRKTLLTMGASLLVFVGVIIGGTGSARADVPANSITHVYMNLNNPSASSQSQYFQLIDSLRAAAGHDYRNGVRAAQYTDFNSLIRLSLANGDTHLDLWITPNDLYVRGFTNTHGDTFQFNDADFSLAHTLQNIPSNGVGAVSTLGFGSNYNSMVQAAGRGRENMPISFNDLWNSVFNLAWTTNPYGGNQVDVARSLLFMIQYTAEAARFNDVYGVMSAIMLNWNNYYNGLPVLQQYLENSWAAISGFGQRISGNPGSAPLTVNGVGTLYTWNDVARYLALILLNLNLPQEGPSGDWNHTEL